ncbi:MAG TPA: hypothetical protein VNT32_05225 [Thermoleophilaceae bacterium]|nr:hypothetical protein [Thermoleophilaceae bacterium]
MAVDARQVPHADVVAALDAVDIGDVWLVARAIRGGVLGQGTPVAQVPDRKTAPILGFRNQVVGRIAERVFRGRHLARLEPQFTIHDYHERGDNRDYGIEGGGAELPVNVKTASTLFRNARQFGLEPEDCIPISSYKALNAIRKVPDLVYVDLVDFKLRERTDAYVEALGGELAILWDLFSWYGGKGAKEAQNRYVDALFAEHGADLDALAPGVGNFRAISAQRVLAILRENPRRCPGLGVKAAGTGAFNAEVNVHVSVAQETWPWDEVERLLLTEGVAAVRRLTTETETRDVPAPRL